MNKNLFTEKQINVAAILAGPIPPGILIYLNYKRLGRDREALISLAVTFIFTISFFFLIMTLPEEISTKIPSFVYTLFYAVLVFAFFRRFMASELIEALEADYLRASNWSVAGYTLMGLVVNVIIIVWIASYQPPFPGQMMTFTKNQIYYEEPVTTSQVEMVSVRLYDSQYFNDEEVGLAHIKVVDSRYRLTFPLDESLWEDRETQLMLESLRLSLERDLGGSVDVVVEQYDLSGETKKRVF